MANAETIIARELSEGHIRLGDRLAAKSEERFSQLMWRREADYISGLCQENSQFCTSYQFFFPPGAIEAVFSYYGIGSSSSDSDEFKLLRDSNVPLFRRLIYHLASLNSPDEEGSFFRRSPLPPRAFLVTGKDTKRFEHLWAESVPTFFTGRVNPDFLPQRVFNGLSRTEFSAERQRLISAYRQRHPNLDRLAELDPQLLYCLEAYYFQGKPVSQIVQEQQIKRGRVYVNKELGLVALRIKQGSKGEAARRYKFWLGPVLQRWEENKKYIAGLPSPVPQKIAWELLKGASARAVAQRFGVSHRDTMPLRQQLLSGVVEREPFLSQRRHQAIEELFTLPFDQQPITQLTQTVLEAKAEGKTYTEIRGILGLDYHQVSYLLRGCLEDLQWTFPDSPDIPPMSRKRLLILPRPGQQLSFLYRRFTAEMVQSGRHLTPRQEKFLEQAQTNLCFTEGGFLALYLKSLKSRWAKREERIGLAKAALRKPANFSLEDQERVRKIAQRTPLSRIFPRGVKDPEFLRLYKQMRQLRESA